MRIHFTLDTNSAYIALAEAGRAAGVYFERKTVHKSRSHAVAFDVILSGDSAHRINSSEFGHENAASWDQWGIFLASLYSTDPGLKTPYYDDAEEFHRVTCNRFNVAEYSDSVDSMAHEDYRRTAHRWTPVYDAPIPFWQCKGHGKANPECSAYLKN